MANMRISSPSDNPIGGAIVRKPSRNPQSNSQQTAAALIPANPTLGNLSKAASACKACDLWERATQTVFGEGSPRAKGVLVGEQPGDREDLAGHPFVGPAGKLLDRALAEAGIGRDEVYITNVVKHFNWAADQRGKKRIHK